MSALGVWLIISDVSCDSFVQTVVFSMPPALRQVVYLNAKFTTVCALAYLGVWQARCHARAAQVQIDVIRFASSAVYLIGFPDMTFSTPILNGLRSSQFLTLFLGLVLNVLLFILSILSALLIYSLLMINVQTRSFELAVRRMLGSRRSAIVQLLVVQSLAYSTPAFIIGIGISAAISQSIMTTFSNLAVRDVIHTVLLHACVSRVRMY